MGDTMSTDRQNWAQERIAGTAQVYEYDDSGVRFWVVACNREQADAVMANTNDPEEMTAYKVRILDHQTLCKIKMRDEDDPTITNMSEALSAYCENFDKAGCLACTEE